MERELYALWQATLGCEKYIRGLLGFVYLDHKNNLFTPSMLDNRRIANQSLDVGLGAAMLQHRVGLAPRGG